MPQTVSEREAALFAGLSEPAVRNIKLRKQAALFQRSRRKGVFSVKVDSVQKNAGTVFTPVLFGPVAGFEPVGRALRGDARGS
jgi:hypothetical protein